MAVAWVLSCAVLLGWALLQSYKEESGTLDPPAGIPVHFEEFFHTQLTVSSVDEVNLVAKVKAEVISEWSATDQAADQYTRVLRPHGVPPMMISKMTIPSADGKPGYMMWSTPLSVVVGQTPWNVTPPTDPTKEPRPPIGPTKEPRPGLDDVIGKATLSFAPLTLQDFAAPFDLSGVAAFADLAPLPLPGPPYKTDPPEQSTELRMLGKPLLYPFDRYILIGRIVSNAIATVDGNGSALLDIGPTEVDVRSPEFIQRDLTFDDLRRLHKVLPKQVGSLLTIKGETKNRDLVFNYLDRAKRNQDQLFAVELRRPFFLRFFAVFLVLISLASIGYYLVKSTVKEFGLQAVGFFLSLWAVRQILMSNGPKLFTLVDYAVFILYFGLIVGIVSKAIYPAKVSQPLK